MQIMTKKQYNFNAVLMLLIGSVALAAGTFMLLSPKQVINIASIKSQKFTDCSSAASLANMKVVQDVAGNKVTISQNDISNFKYTLASSSFVVSECVGFELKKMCMGSGCTSPGFTMDLIYAQPKASPIQEALSKPSKIDSPPKTLKK